MARHRKELHYISKGQAERGLLEQILLMMEILRYLKHRKLWESWYIPDYG